MCSQKIDSPITKEFLLNAIQKESNSSQVEIISYDVTSGSKPGDNYMSIIYAIDVNVRTENSESSNERHLLMKCYPNHPARQSYNNQGNSFYKELETYKRWLPALRKFQTEVVGLDKSDTLKLPYPHLVHGECIDFESSEGQSKKDLQQSPLDNYIIFEDVKKTFGFKMTNRKLPLDLEHMLLVISELAKIHALSWAYRHHVEKYIVKKFPCLLPTFQEDMELWVSTLSADLDLAKEIFDEQFGPGNEYTVAMEKFQSNLGKVMEYFMGKISAAELGLLHRLMPDEKRFGKDAENPEPWKIISHGDVNVNNLLFRYDPATAKPIEVILVDLQMPLESCVTNDLQYLIYANTDAQLRRAHLATMLQVYHDSFNKCCNLLKTPTLPGFCIESLKYRFHITKLLGFFMGNLVYRIMLSEDEIPNFDDLDPSIPLEEAFNSQINKGNIKENKAFKKRLIEVTRDMIDDGVL